MIHFRGIYLKNLPGYTLILLAAFGIMTGIFIQNGSVAYACVEIIFVAYLLLVIVSRLIRRIHRDIKNVELICIVSTVLSGISLLVLKILILKISPLGAAEGVEIKGRLYPLYLNELIFLLGCIDFFVAVTGQVLTTYVKNMELNNHKMQYANDRYEIDRVNRMYEEARGLRHDLKHCVVTVKGYMNEQQYDKAEQILDKIVNEKIDSFGYIKYCNNKILNFMINDKFERCRRSVITAKCIVMGEMPEIDDIDLSILLGNLLDNAIEAAEKSQEKYINLEIYARNNISISVENSIKESVLHKQTPFATTKADSEKHGFGVHSIYDIVNRYKGEISYKEEDGLMVCNVMLLGK